MGHYICSTRENAKYWFNWSCCGVTMLIFIQSIFVASNLVTIFITIPISIHTLWKKIVCICLTEVLCILSQWSHIRCVFTDPGSVPSDAEPLSTATEEEKEKKCEKCGSYKPPRAHHCRECNRCIVKMDHHCPWINNCVGILNTKFFLLFLAYTFLYCIYSIALCICYFVHRMTVETEPVYYLVLTLMESLYGLFFAAFTISMFVESIGLVTSGTTAIDTLKGNEYSSDLHSNLKEVFGGKGEFSFSWLLPLTPVLVDRDDVLGFHRGLSDGIVVCGSSDWVD